VRPSLLKFRQAPWRAHPVRARAWFYFRIDPGIAQSIAVLFKEGARRRAMEALGPRAAEGIAKAKAAARLTGLKV
jgi:hypothetical protein